MVSFVQKFIKKYIKKILIYILSLLLDIGLFNAGIIIGFFLRFVWSHGLEWPEENWRSYILMYQYMLIVPGFVFILFNLYRRSWSQRDFEEIKEVWCAVFVSLVFLALIIMWLRSDFTEAIMFPTGVFIIAGITNCFLLTLWRLIWRSMALSRMPEKIKKVLIIGNIEKGVAMRILENKVTKYSFIGCVGMKNEKPEYDIPVLGELENITTVIHEGKPDEVFIIAATYDNDEMFVIIQILEHEKVFYRIIPSLYTIMATTTNVKLVNDIPMFEVGKSEISGWNMFMKRLIDVALSLFLLLFSLPIIFIACVCIVIDSKGWPIFVQERVGQYGRRFKVYKLRTMVVDKPGAVLTLDNDPRISKFSHFLRKTSIDELPQLFNVLLGDMSLIGPRAVIPYVVDQFKDWEKASLNVKPGLSGLAQVSGRDELGFHDKSVLNIFYIRTYSIALDLRIVLQTLKVVLFTHVGTAGTRQDK